MASYLDLVGQAMMIQREYDNRRTRNAAAASTPSGSPFEGMLQTSLQKAQVQLASVPETSSSMIDLELYLPSGEEDAFRKSVQFVLAKEGSRYVKEDGGSRESSRYGILQSTAKTLGYKGDVRYLTKEAAEKIYKKIWDQSGAGSLPFPLSAVHFDTYVNSPAAAKKILEKSRGDINTYLGLRERRYVRLATSNPEVFGKYLKGWKARVQSLRSMVAAHTKPNTYAANSSTYPVKIG